MKRTGGIIATILTSIFLGIPGIFLGLLGLIAIVAPSTQAPADKQLGSLVLMGGGLILMLIPIIVGATTLRKKNAPVSAPPVTPQPIPTSPPVASVSQSVPPVMPVIAPLPKSTPSPASPEPSAPDPAAEIRSRLLSLNRATSPYQVIDGAGEGVDLIAEWKIVDAQWREVFTKAKLSKVFRIFLKFDPEKRVVLAMDREYSLQWHAGIPTLGVEASFFKGQQSSISLGTGYSFTEEPTPGQVYKYRFNTNELKKPIQEAISAAGWKYKGVAFGKL